MRTVKTKTIIKVIPLILSGLLLSACASWGPPPEEEAGVAGVTRRDDYRIAATSAAILEILDRLDYDHVVGIPETEKTIPARYGNLPKIGAPMDPDLELVKQLAPDIILSPMTLESSLAGDYTGADIRAGFLNLASVEGMYEGIASLGALLAREEQAKELTEDYHAFLAQYETPEEAKDILLLMCFPDGFYLVCTENCYVGNLLQLAGAHNVYSSSEEGMESGFVNINPEDIVQRNPDKIFIFAHYNEEDAFAYMREELRENATWQFFDAVKNNEVYYLGSDRFGMSATFAWKEALEALHPMLYGE